MSPQTEFLDSVKNEVDKLRKQLDWLESGARVGRRIPYSCCEHDRTVHTVENLKREIAELEQLIAQAASRTNGS